MLSPARESHAGRRPGRYKVALMAIENCTLCRGTGWKLVPRKDGTTAQLAVPCECGLREREQRVLERAQIPKRYEHCDFESYVTDLADGNTYTLQQEESLKRAKMTAQSFVRDYPGNDQTGILFMGNSGVGKTHLAIAALKELLRRGHSGYFCEYGALLREIQQSYASEAEATESRLLAPVLSVEVLVIDDLGCIKPSDWVRDTVGYILNTRYIDGSRDLSHPRCTIITTNYSDRTGERDAVLPSRDRAATRKDTLADRISERMRSRLYEMCRTLEISAPDFRREKTQAGRARV
jgi:DNA replication protein DnaC